MQEMFTKATIVYSPVRGPYIPLHRSCPPKGVEITLETKEEMVCQVCKKPFTEQYPEIEPFDLEKFDKGEAPYTNRFGEAEPAMISEAPRVLRPRKRKSRNTTPAKT